jgi:hypothetical protein
MLDPWPKLRASRIIVFFLKAYNKCKDVVNMFF